MNLNSTQARQRRWYLRNKDRINARNRARRKADPEKYRERSRALYAASPERREKQNAIARRWRKRNRAHKLKADRTYYRRNCDALRAKAREYRRKHPAALRDASLRRLYGLSPNGYDELHRKQGGRCAVCRLPPKGRHKRLHVDHCHTRKRVRGLLCGPCNTALGLLGEDPKRFAAAVRYLRISPLTTPRGSGRILA